MIMKMTSEELQELGIKKTTAPGRGCKSTTAYEYKCASCGRPVLRFALILDRPIYCNLCRTNAKKRVAIAKEKAERQKIELDSLDTADTNKKQRFEKAAQKMQRLGGYEDAIQRAAKAYEKYDSVPEAIAAIVLLKAGYRVIAQQKLANYKLDFTLPDEKFVIEIDGTLYHQDQTKIDIRDDLIKYMLGGGWDIVHVPAEALAKRPKAFEHLIEKRIAKKAN